MGSNPTPSACSAGRQLNSLGVTAPQTLAACAAVQRVARSPRHIGEGLAGGPVRDGAGVVCGLKSLLQVPLG